MRAVLHDAYGEPGEVLRLESIEVPQPGRGEVLIRVRAAALNQPDVFITRGKPRALRALYGLGRPKAGMRVRGSDVAGVVEAVGEGVTALKPGDAVFGEARGSLADYTIAPQGRLAPKPSSLSFEQAAAVSMAGVVVVAGLRVARLRPGQRMLVIGASGGIGSLVVQAAVAAGAQVTGVCSTPNVELVRSLGATRVIDYLTEDLLQDQTRYDVILDNVGSTRLRDLRRLLTPRGTLLPNSGEHGPDGGPYSRVARAALMGLVSRQRIRGFTSAGTTAMLGEVVTLVERDGVRPLIDREIPLEEAAAGLEHVASRRARGKVVVKVSA